MATSTAPALKVLEPATEQTLAELPEAQVEDVEEAIARAKAAFPTWRAVAPRKRSDWRTTPSRTLWIDLD
jgi:acyl-CoA reductase-like NAD-dependent aldehyde dehydrogenase